MSVTEMNGCPHSQTAEALRMTDFGSLRSAGADQNASFSGRDVNDGSR